MKPLIRYPSLLLICGLSLLFTGGCAAWSDFCGDMGISGVHPHGPHGGNWLDNILPEEPPGNCPNCRSDKGPSPSGDGDSDFFGWMHGSKTPPPQVATTRLHPVPTRPVFSPVVPEGAVASTARKPGDPRKPAEKPRTTGGNSGDRNRIAAAPGKAVRTEPRPSRDEYLPIESPKKSDSSAEGVHATSGSTTTPEREKVTPPLLFSPPKFDELRQPEPFETPGEGSWRPVVPGGSNGW